MPTLRACLLALLAAALLAFVTIRGLYPFLAVTDPAPGGVLVVEGWGSDYALEIAMGEFKRDHYARLLVTGIPLEEGAPLAEYKNYAKRGEAILLKLGMSTNDVQAVPTPLTQRDRTYAMALSVGAWLREHQMPGGNVNLVTQGPHARRSRLMYAKALGTKYNVGVISVPSRSYDEHHWWRSSQGVRTVLGELIAYSYARFIFRPGN